MRTQKFLAALLLSTSAITASAAPLLAGDYSGIFTTPTGSTSAFVYSGAGTNQLLWGTNTGLGGTTDPLTSNSLTIDDAAFGPQDFSGVPMGTMLIGTISWTNQSTFNSGGTWESSADIDVTYNSPSSTGPLSSVFSFTVANTADSGIPGGIPDELTSLVVSGADFTGTPLDLGSGLAITGYFAAIEDEGTVGASSYDAFSGDWINAEGNTSVLGIYANVEVQAIPLPAAVWLFGSSLFGLVVVARRKKAA